VPHVGPKLGRQLLYDTAAFFLVGSFWLDHVPVASCWASGWDRIWAANCVKFHSSARMIPWNASRKIKF